MNQCGRQNGFVLLPGPGLSSGTRATTGGSARLTSLVTLREWAAEIGRSYNTIRVH
jgi:hypothetical protein